MSMVPIFVGGALVYALSAGAGFLYWKIQSVPPGCRFCEDHVTPDELKRAYEDNASTYDGAIEIAEFLSLDSLRKNLIQDHAQGSKCLEVAVGTGRNFKHYPEGLTVMAVDSSPKMLLEAKKKIVNNDTITTTVADAHELIDTFGEKSFDTVVSTFGMCSFADPVKVLREIGSVVKKDGVILLLEHGKSAPQYSKSFSRWLGGEWLSAVLDFYAEKHAQRWGCWWNRDIVGIVEEAGLSVRNIETFQMGTVYAIVCAPPTAE